ncbi:DNRLRE domain-containing protein [bacterium]|nr:DNRLRE domain-containing protein [bacterium]
MRTSLIFTAFLAILFTACQNEPDPTGIGLVPEGDLIDAQRFDTADDDTRIQTTSFHDTLAPYNAVSLMIGTADGYESSAFIRWYQLSDTVGRAGRIVSASIKLFSLPGSIGDSTASMTLNVYEIQEFWNSFTFTSDSVDMLDVAAVPSGSITATIGGADSVEIPLDSTLVRSWLEHMADGEFTQVYGVKIDGANSNVLRPFQSSENASPPVLTVIMELNGELDTLRGASIDDTYGASGPEFPSGPDMTLHSGLTQRSRLFFDVSSIEGAPIVNYARLFLHIDRSRTTSHFSGVDSIIIYQNYDSTLNHRQGTGILTRIDDTDENMIVAEGVTLTRAVQDWVNGKGNHGLLLVPYAENNELERLTIFGAEADSTRRPRLQVTYTSKP